MNPISAKEPILFNRSLFWSLAMIVIFSAACNSAANAAQWTAVSQSSVPADVSSYFHAHYKTDHGTLSPVAGLCFAGIAFGGRPTWTRYVDALTDADNLNGVTSHVIYAVQYPLYRSSLHADWKENDATGPTNGEVATITRTVRHGKVSLKNTTFCL